MFVGADHAIRADQWTLGVGAAVVTTAGVPTHTGRGHRDEASAHAGAMKALLDFFLLTETDVLASNCAYVCSGGLCGNTYMFKKETSRNGGRAQPAFAWRDFGGC